MEQDKEDKMKLYCRSSSLNPLALATNYTNKSEMRMEQKKIRLGLREQYCSC